MLFVFQCFCAYLVTASPNSVLGYYIFFSHLADYKVVGLQADLLNKEEQFQKIELLNEEISNSKDEIKKLKIEKSQLLSHLQQEELEKWVVDVLKYDLLLYSKNCVWSHKLMGYCNHLLRMWYNKLYLS